MRVTEEAVSFAEATFVKKKMYYNMRIKMVKRNASDVIKRANDIRHLRLTQAYAKVCWTRLCCVIPSLRRFFFTSTHGGACIDSDIFQLCR